ncbi:hypothetical protein ACTXT7_014061 [Hymenolepis weldensis]
MQASVSSSNSYGLMKSKTSGLNRTTLGPIRGQKFVAFTYLKAERRLKDDYVFPELLFIRIFYDNTSACQLPAPTLPSHLLCSSALSLSLTRFNPIAA